MIKFKYGKKIIVASIIVTSCIIIFALDLVIRKYFIKDSESHNNPTVQSSATTTKQDFSNSNTSTLIQPTTTSTKQDVSPKNVSTSTKVNSALQSQTKQTNKTSDTKTDVAQIGNRAQLENYFNKVLENGIESVFLHFAYVNLQVVDTFDVHDLAEEVNILSALINIGKTSTNSVTKDLALSLESGMIHYQKSHFPLFREDYIRFLNKGRQMDDNFEYPNRCIRGISDCDIFYLQEILLKKDLSATAIVNPDGTTQYYVDYSSSTPEEIITDKWSKFLGRRSDDLKELRVSLAEVTFAGLTDPNHSLYLESFKKEFRAEVPNDDELMPISYLGL